MEVVKAPLMDPTVEAAVLDAHRGGPAADLVALMRARRGDDALDSKGCTALHYAAKGGQLELLTLLTT